MQKALDFPRAFSHLTSENLQNSPKQNQKNILGRYKVTVSKKFKLETRDL